MTKVNRCSSMPGGLLLSPMQLQAAYPNEDLDPNFRRPNARLSESTQRPRCDSSLVARTLSSLPQQPCADR